MAMRGIGLSQFGGGAAPPSPALVRHGSRAGSGARFSALHSASKVAVLEGRTEDALQYPNTEGALMQRISSIPETYAGERNHLGGLSELCSIDNCDPCLFRIDQSIGNQSLAGIGSLPDDMAPRSTHAPHVTTGGYINHANQGQRKRRMATFLGIITCSRA